MGIRLTMVEMIHLRILDLVQRFNPTQKNSLNNDESISKLDKFDASAIGHRNRNIYADSESDQGYIDDSD